MKRHAPRLDPEHPCEWDTWSRDERERRVLLCLLNASSEGRGALTATQIAWRLHISRTRRLGSGARGPSSYSGHQGEALRVVPMLRSLERRGAVHSSYRRGTRYVNEYQLSGHGRALARLAPRVVA